MKVSKFNPVEANKKLLTPKQKVGREGDAEVTTFMESIKFKASRYSSLLYWGRRRSRKKT
jgi:hypothetical protein